MKIKIEVEIDCTPEELKSVWNVPDLGKAQHELSEAVAQQVRKQFTIWPVGPWAQLLGLAGQAEREPANGGGKGRQI